MTSETIEARNLVEALRVHAQQRPDHPAYVFLSDGENVTQSLSYAELDYQARRFAAGIRRSAAPGDRALLLYHNGPEFVRAFIGCMYAGVISVPSVIPHLKNTTPRLIAILEDAGAKVACATGEVHARLQPLMDQTPGLANLHWMVDEDIPQGAIEAVEVAIDPETTAFLQYTSGSTSTPKGVMVSHGSLLATLTDLKRGMELGSETVMVAWVPFFHDLGLVVNLLATLFVGGTLYSMTPITFIESPRRWLAAISKYRGTHTAAPNFAYQLCVNKLSDADKDQLDLSTLKYAMNAAEPVRLATLREFGVAFSRCGFDYNAAAPLFGLAEATLMVSTKPMDQPPAYCTLDAQALENNKLVFLPQDQPGGYASVGCGRSCINADIRIVDPETRRASPPDELGEIWVKSASVAQGYWNRPAESRETFQAVTADDGAGPFLRTGDAGFLHQGELHIGGRIKDMLIFEGRNLYPQDIELTVERCHPAPRLGCGAAFSVDDGKTEHLVIVQEIRKEFRNMENLDEVLTAIQMAVARDHGIRAAAVVLIEPNTVSKTSSGKIQRRANRQAFLRGSLRVLREWRAPGFLAQGPQNL